MMQDKAKVGQVFICKVCSRTFFDRAATMPVALEMKDAVVGVAIIQPHHKYPADADLATLVYEDQVLESVVIDERTAVECCATHSVLCSATRVRFRKELDGTINIVGAEHLE